MIRHFCYATESIVGLLATFIIGFIPPVLLFLGSLPFLVNGNFPLFLLCLIGGGLTGFLAGYVARLASRVVDRNGLQPAYIEPTHEPIGVADDSTAPYGFDEEAVPAPYAIPLVLAMAHELPPMRNLFRGTLAVWWLAHFGLAVFAGHVSASIVSASLVRPSPETVFTVGLVLHMALLFAANLYLLLAVAVVEPDQSIWYRVWDYRLPIDLTLALCSTVVPELFR
jgi:hypothetical protein